MVVVAAGAAGLGTTTVLAHHDKPMIEDLTAAANTAGTGLDLAWKETGLTADTTSGGKVTYVGSTTLKWTFRCPDSDGAGKDTEKVVRTEHIAIPFTSNAMVSGTITESVKGAKTAPPLMPKGCDPVSLTVKDITITDVTNGVSAKTEPVTFTL